MGGSLITPCPPTPFLSWWPWSHIYITAYVVSAVCLQSVMWRLLGCGMDMPITLVGSFRCSPAHRAGRSAHSSVSLTCMKYSSSKQSTHGSATSMGRTSLEISQHFMRIIFS